MAKVQTRMSISVSRAAYVAAKAMCDAEERSLASVVDAFLRDLTGLPPNKYTTKPEPEPKVALPPRAELDEIAAARRMRVLATPVAPEPTPIERTAPRASFCAVCTADTPAGSVMEPLGRNGALVVVCANCRTLTPRSGKYSFSESTALPQARTNRYGSEGNRRTSRRMS